MPWVVMKLFNAQKELMADAISIHSSMGNALGWAKRACYEEYGEVCDVSNSRDLYVYGVEEIYGPRDPYEKWTYYVCFAPCVDAEPEPIPDKDEEEEEAGSDEEEDSD